MGSPDADCLIVHQERPGNSSRTGAIPMEAGRWVVPKDLIDVPAVNIGVTDKEYVLEIGTHGLEKVNFRIESPDQLLRFCGSGHNGQPEWIRYNPGRCDFSHRRRSFALRKRKLTFEIMAGSKNEELRIHILKSNTGREIPV